VPDKLSALGDDHLAIDLADSVVLAVTGSPGLFFFASTGRESVAFTAVPFERLVEFCSALADDEAALLLETCAPDLPASADVPLAPEELACAPVWAYAAVLHPRSAPARRIVVVACIVDGLLQDEWVWVTGTNELVAPIVVEGRNLARPVLSDRSRTINCPDGRYLWP
jgi:hypothetical protein